ncbi:MAG: hypothetical protein QF560_07560 [SAR324 cluster bacterium]|jgi:hypothetical protein|nr:hypothetical protein [SAR324 cluster bacterium]MDP7331456.1 hypothetical protein [SAR324 cluster bacterium]HJO43535.1 hypothetical protein [SAR324 cluster bacterium]
MLKTKHLKSLLILWILIMQGCIFTETLMGKKYSPINRCRDAWCWHKDRAKREKLIKLAEMKRGIHKKREPLQLRLRYFNGEISSGKSRLQNQSIAVHWKNWGLGQTQSDYQSEGLYGIGYSSITQTHDLLYTFGNDFNFTLGLSFANSGKSKIKFLEHEYLSEKVSGNGMLLGTGIKWGLLEFLIRKSKFEYIYSDFKREGSVDLGKDLKIKSETLSFGLGLSF